jgi:MFS transporter, DHA1 family, multidrug resistance protein
MPIGRIIFLASLTMLAALSTDIYLPSLPAIATDFEASPAAVQNSVTAYFLGLAVSQAVSGPVSDRLGRRPVLLAGLLVFIAASVLSSQADSVGALATGRFLQAAGACAVLVAVRASISDQHGKKETAAILSQISVFVGLIPLLAPFFGALLLDAGGWRAAFHVLTSVGIVLGIAAYFSLGETWIPDTVLEKKPRNGSVSLLGNQRAMGYALCGAFNVACFFVYLTASSSLMIERYGYSPEEFAILLAVNALGLVVASQLNRILLARFSVDHILRFATLAAMPCGAALVYGSFADDLSWQLFGLFGVVSSYGFIAANAAAGALDVVKSRSGSVLALAGSLSFFFGFVGSALSAKLHDGTARPMAILILSCLLLSLLALRLLTQSKNAEIRR